MRVLTFLILPLTYRSWVFERRVLWWRALFLTRVLLIIVRWNRGILPLSLFNYFFREELLGLLLLISLHRWWRATLLLAKIGVREWFFWTYFIALEWKRSPLFWILLYRKLPYLPPLLGFMEEGYRIEIALGLLFILPFIWSIKAFNPLLLLRSSQRFTLSLILLSLNLMEIRTLLLFYSLNFLLIIRGENIRGSLEKMFYFFRVPINFSFFFKFIRLSLLVRKSRIGVLFFTLLVGAVRGGFLLILAWTIYQKGNLKQNLRELLIRGLLFIVLII